MNPLPCFLTVLGLSFVLQACAPAPTAPPPSSPAVAVAPTRDATRLDAGSLYNTLPYDKLARALRGEPELPTIESDSGSLPPMTIEMICMSSGRFNIAPDGESLEMQTWCAERYEGDHMTTAQLPDVIVPRVPDTMVFRTPFRKTVVTVEDLPGGGREVRLHYNTPGGGADDYTHLVLHPREGEPYRYSFAPLCPDTVFPIGEIRIMEFGQDS